MRVISRTILVLFWVFIYGFVIINLPYTITIANSESLTGKPFATYWLHNGYVNIDREKMSKSLGNYVNIGDLLKYYSSDAVRLFVLQNHYRSPITFTEDSMDQSQVTADRLFNTMLLTKYYSISDEETEATREEDLNLAKKIDRAKSDFIVSMNEDFNTSVALATVFDIMHEVNDYVRKVDTIHGKIMQEADAFFLDIRSVFGLYEDFNKYTSFDTLEQLVNLLIELRQNFRKEKNWEMSDKIRDNLKKAGILLEDTPKRILWKFSES